MASGVVPQISLIMGPCAGKFNPQISLIMGPCAGKFNPQISLIIGPCAGKFNPQISLIMGPPIFGALMSEFRPVTTALCWDRYE